MQQIQNFGEPFFLIIHEGETFAVVKDRIQKKLQVSDEEYSKVHPIFINKLLHSCALPTSLIVELLTIILGWIRDINYCYSGIHEIILMLPFLSVARLSVIVCMP